MQAKGRVATTEFSPAFQGRGHSRSLNGSSRSDD